MKVPRRRVDGVLLLDKPRGLSSNAALQRAKRLFCAAKAGHTGTLDPLASGLLPLCFGEATKFAQSLLDARKEYLATLRFGIRTSTGDAEGEVAETSPVIPDRAAIVAVLPRFTGEQEQVPPRHAALKHEGRSYYEYARAGVEIPRPARRILIDTLALLSCEPPVAVLRVGCSKGTYVRSLAEDLAAGLGSVAHLAALRRTASGPFRLDDAVGLEALEAMSTEERMARLLPIDAALAGLPRLTLTAVAAADLIHGRTVAAPDVGPGKWRVYDPGGGFLGLAEVAQGRLQPERLVDTTPHRAGNSGHSVLALES